MKREYTLGGVILVALPLYLLGVWFHIPYGGGHIYSDIVTVFQVDLCPSASACKEPIPYVQAFVEYPIGTAFFMYAMGVLGGLVPGHLLSAYYAFTCIFLLAPTLLLVRELHTIARMRGVGDSKLLWFFVVTPTFIFMLLVNWYVIGTYFTFAGIRYFLQGRKKTSAVFLGLSALSNLITATPAVGLLLSESKVKNVVSYASIGASTYLLPNLLVYLSNPKNWLMFWHYQYDWYVEDSWMEAIMNNESPLRHVVPTVLFAVFFAAMVAFRFRRGEKDPLFLSFLAAFSFVFSTYVYTPQMNVFLLPFMVLLPVTSHYLEFLSFDILNSAIIVVGFSQFLLPLGITYSIAQFGNYSPVQIVAMVRSLWVGKFLVYNGFYLGWRQSKKQSGTAAPLERPSP